MCCYREHSLTISQSQEQINTWNHVDYSIWLTYLFSEVSLILVLCHPLQVFQWQLFSQQPPVFRAGRCAVVRTRQGQTWNPGLRPSYRGQKSPIDLSYCLSTVPHYYPSTTNNLILKAPQKPCPDGTGGLNMSLPSALHPSHHLFIIPLCHSSAGQGHAHWAPIRADFTGQTEKCHLSCWTVALQHHRGCSSLTLSIHAVGRWGMEQWEERAHKDIKHSAQTQQNQRRLFQDLLFHISSSVP